MTKNTFCRMNGNVNTRIAYQDVSETQPRAAALQLIRRKQRQLASIMGHAAAAVPQKDSICKQWKFYTMLSTTSLQIERRRQGGRVQKVWQSEREREVWGEGVRQCGNPSRSVEQLEKKKKKNK